MKQLFFSIFCKIESGVQNLSNATRFGQKFASEIFLLPREPKNLEKKSVKKKSLGTKGLIAVKLFPQAKILLGAEF